MSKLVVTNIETQNIKFDSDTTAFTIASDGTTTGAGANKTVIIANDTTPKSVLIAGADPPAHEIGVIIPVSYTHLTLPTSDLV